MNKLITILAYTLWITLIALFVFVVIWLMIQQEYITALFLELIVIAMGLSLLILEKLDETHKT